MAEKRQVNQSWEYRDWSLGWGWGIARDRGGKMATGVESCWQKREKPAGLLEFCFYWAARCCGRLTSGWAVIAWGWRGNILSRELSESGTDILGALGQRPRSLEHLAGAMWPAAAQCSAGT
jgi:hypothetical protein